LLAQELKRVFYNIFLKMAQMELGATPRAENHEGQLKNAAYQED